jgi:hypothetical protein
VGGIVRQGSGLAARAVVFSSFLSRSRALY